MQRRARYVIDDRLVLGKLAVLVDVANDLYLLAVLVVRVREVDVVVVCEVGMERDIHQTALAGRLDVRNGEDWLYAKLTFLDDPNAAFSLGEEHVTVRQPREGPWDLKSARDPLDAEFNAVL